MVQLIPSCWGSYLIYIVYYYLTIVCFSKTVQHECIPQAILSMDVLCQAKSGMGKTAVFVLATLQQLEPVDGQVSSNANCSNEWQTLISLSLSLTLFSFCLFLYYLCITPYCLSRIPLDFYWNLVLSLYKKQWNASYCHLPIVS